MLSSPNSACNCLLVYLLLLVTVSLVVYIAWDSYSRGGGGGRSGGGGRVRYTVAAAPSSPSSTRWLSRGGGSAWPTPSGAEGFVGGGGGGGDTIIGSAAALRQFDEDNGPKILWLHHKGCVHCHNMKGAWAKVVQRCPSGARTYSASNAQGAHWRTLCERYNATGFPTILVFRSKDQYAEHNGPRDARSMLAALRERAA
jgi:hypothetical protein